MRFSKYHGLGNDYLVIEPSEIGVELTADRIRLICNRNYGVGSDAISMTGPVTRVCDGTIYQEALIT